MALNTLMHQRNPYKDHRPDFQLFSEKYEKFRKIANVDPKGKPHLDFKNPECIRALSWALLKNDFDLDVEMPVDRLIPTVPLRLNYILWLEDIFQNLDVKSLKGIDIGTGAACIYPLLAAKMNDWHFLATEVDDLNYKWATHNVSQNNMETSITVKKVDEGCTLLDTLQTTDEKFDFCMCNPPFYGSNLEAWGMLTSRSDKRSEPSSVSTASPVECISPGGEVQYVKEIIQSSLELKERVRVYTSMLGKKCSLKVLREELRQNNITNVGTTEFCQGKTMRWGLGWSFDNTVVFPKAPSKLAKASKPKPPLVYVIPHSCTHETSFADVAKLIKDILHELQMVFTAESATETHRQWHVRCQENTWSHQRRKRRQKEREQNSSSDTSPEKKCQSQSDDDVTLPRKRSKLDSDVCSEARLQKESVKKSTSNSDALSEKQDRERNDNDADASTTVLQQAKDIDTKPLIEATVSLKLDNGAVLLEMQTSDACDRPRLHEVLQYFKNRLK